MQSSGVENAIRELEREGDKIRAVITMLKRIQAQRSAVAPGSVRPKRRLSAKARKKISEASKKRWAALRNAKADSGKTK